MHPLPELEQLKQRAATHLIKAYFTSRTLNSSALRTITHAQLTKCTAALKGAKLKQIYKDRVRRVAQRRGCEEGGLEL